MKLGIVYTSTTPELIECVNEEQQFKIASAPSETACMYIPTRRAAAPAVT